MVSQYKSYAFTIVELLIVVVVVAILATITVVSYNGITARTKEASIKSDVVSAKKMMEVFKITNNRYPESSSEAALKPSGGISSDYTPYDGGAGYCAHFASGSLNYYVTSATDPKEGVCDTVTNIITNPSLETASTNWMSRWFGSGGGAGIDDSHSELAGLCGSYGWRRTWTVSGTGFQDVGVRYDHSPIVAGQTYNFNAAMRSSFVTTYRFFIEWLDGGNVVLSTSTLRNFPAPVANSWYMLKMTATAPANTVKGRIIWGPYPQGSEPGHDATIPVGATVDADCLMVAQVTNGYISEYADGDSTNWSWSGAAHASTSSGPAY